MIVLKKLSLVAGLLVGISIAVFAAARSSAAPEKGKELAPCVCSEPVWQQEVTVGGITVERVPMHLFHCKCGALDCAFAPPNGLSCTN